MWPFEYFSAIPTLIMHYGIYFSFSAMIAVTTRNAAACVIGSILFWLLCWGMNVGRDAIVVYDFENFSAVSRSFSEIGYWILPKPADLCAGTWLTLNPEPLTAYVADFAKVQEKGAILAHLFETVVTGFCRGDGRNLGPPNRNDGLLTE